MSEQAAAEALYGQDPRLTSWGSIVRPDLMALGGVEDASTH